LKKILIGYKVTYGLCAEDQVMNIHDMTNVSAM